MKTLNIKDPHGYRLARELAARTGESLTQAVVQSLRERLERTRPARRGLDPEEEMKGVAERICALPVLDARSEDEILGYDDRGLLDGSHGH